MKKIFFYSLAALTLLSLSSCAEKKNVITGHFDGLTADSLQVEVVDILNARTPLSSTVVPAVNGDFTIPLPTLQSVESLSTLPVMREDVSME